MSNCTVPLSSAIKSDSVPKYPFLAYPPPPRKKRPTPPPPSPRTIAESVPTSATRARSSTFSAIATWVANVQTGSPTSISPRSPHSPRRRPSLGHARRTSISSICATSASFLNLAPTPTTAHYNTNTPSVSDFKADLTTVGYTSVFLQFPNTPISASIPLPVTPRSPDAFKKSPVFPILFPTSKITFSPFRSLSVFGSRSSCTSADPSSPTKMKAKAAALSAAIVKRKKAKYALRPPPLANELALMQFADGGNIDNNIKRVMQAQAKAAGGIGVADVHRDGEGGIWWDQDEEWEYAHLLAEGDQSFPHATGELSWVTFNGNSSPSTTGPLDEERRGSVSTQDSDLDPKYIVQPSDMLDTDDLAVFGSGLVPLSTCKPAMSVLGLPSRPRRTAMHLHKPDFLVDLAFERVPLSPKSPFSTSSFASARESKPKGKARRRPTPLKLFPPSHAFNRPADSPIDADKVRKDFIEASFEPSVPATPSTPQTALNIRGRRLAGSRIINIPRTLTAASSTNLPSPLKKTMSKKPSMLNMIGLFRSSRKEDEPSPECTVH